MERLRSSNAEKAILLPDGPMRGKRCTMGELATCESLPVLISRSHTLSGPDCAETKASQRPSLEREGSRSEGPEVRGCGGAVPLFWLGLKGSDQSFDFESMLVNARSS